MAKQTIPTVEEVISHFRSLDVTERQKKDIYENSMKNQYIVVTHGRMAIFNHAKYQSQRNLWVDKDIRVKDRIGHCTRCHREFVLPKDCRLSNEDEFVCPFCGGHHHLISAYRGRETKTIKQYITFFESSIKDPSVILCKGVLAVRDVSGNYRECETKYYTVTLYFFKKGVGSVLYVRDVYYNQYSSNWDKWIPYGLFVRTGPDGISSPWRQQIQLGDKFKVWYERGFSAFWDRKSFGNMLHKKEFKHCGFKQLHGLDCWGDKNIYFMDALLYLQVYCKYPHIEFLIKSGMGNIVIDKIYYRGHSTEPCINWRAKDRKKFLKFTLTKADKQYLRTHVDVHTESFNVLALAQKCGQHISLQEADEFRTATIISIDNKTKSIPDIRKIKAYCDKQQNLMENKKTWNLMNFVHDYMDYTDECKILGYDMSDKGILWPKNLNKAHKETCYLVNLKKIKKDADKNNYGKKIKRIAKKLEYLAYENDKFIIRPAASVDEMIIEGGCNHNCVGTYIERYASGQTYILLIREKECLDIPYYTMEVNPDGKMIQCRTKFNDIAEKGSSIDSFIKKYNREVLEKISIKGVRTA